jgi:hypothetical protein
MDKVPVYISQEEPTARLQWSRVDGNLYQLWLIKEWGNKEGLGVPMNAREEWRAIPWAQLTSQERQP